MLKNGTFVLEGRGKAKNIFAGIQKRMVLFFCNQRQGGTRNRRRSKKKVKGKEKKEEKRERKGEKDKRRLEKSRWEASRVSALLLKNNFPLVAIFAQRSSNQQ